MSSKKSNACREFSRIIYLLPWLLVWLWSKLKFKLSFNGTIILLFIGSIFAFAGIYFSQTKDVKIQLDEVLKRQISNPITIRHEIMPTNGMTNFITNVIIMDDQSISKLDKAIEDTLITQGGYTREYVNQIIKNSTDLTSFWLAFLSVFMVVFTLFSIVTNSNILKKSEEEFKKVEEESDRIIAKLEKKYKATIKELEAIKSSVKLSEKNTEEYKDETNATSLFAQGNQAVSEKKYEDAIKYYTEAIDLNKNYREAYNNRGIAYSELKDYKEAIKDYDKAINLNKNYSAAYCNRGNAYRLWGDDLKQDINSVDEENYYNKAMDNYNRAGFELLSKNEVVMDLIRKLAESGNAKAIEFCNKHNIGL